MVYVLQQKWPAVEADFFIFNEYVISKGGSPENGFT